MPTVAFPFIEVSIDTSGLAATAQRSPGVIAVVGSALAGGTNRGEAEPNIPHVVATLDDARTLFGSDGTTLTPTPLSRSLELAMNQSPGPSRIYGVKVDGNAVAAALSSLEAADDVTFVSLAETTGAGPLGALKTHVENMSSQGNRRIGVAMVDPDVEKSATYAADVIAAAAGLKSDSSRMIIVAARGATTDAATATMAAIAGFRPHISTVLKRVRGVRIPLEQQYSPSEIGALAEANLLPLIDPALVPGESLHMAEGRCFTTDTNLLYIDTVRTLDDIEFRLKAGLIGLVGDARITKAGLTRLRTRVEGILGPLQRQAVIDGFSVDIPVLDILSLPPSSWNASDTAIVTEARSERAVDLIVTVVYGPAVHRLRVELKPVFA
ncbi:MAG: hypothetical protein KG028_01805 [Actinobacteria bacterium]|jgi:hypothetical protein|nr:hypothetical protein [Actinomycetota bacterium]